MLFFYFFEKTALEVTRQFLPGKLQVDILGSSFVTDSVLLYMNR